jgi:hypothetical protein
MLLSEVRMEAPQVKSQMLRPAKTTNKRELLSQVRTEGSSKVKALKLHHVAAPVNKQDMMTQVRRNKEQPHKQSAIVKKQEFVQTVTSQMDQAKQNLKHVQPAGKQELLSGVRVEGKDVKKHLIHVEPHPATASSTGAGK